MNYIETLLANYFTGNCDDNEKVCIDKWKTECPENLQLFEQYQLLWQKSPNFSLTFAPDVENALQNIYKTLKINVIPNKQKRNTWINLSLKIAAGILILFGVGHLFQKIISSSNKEITTFSTTRVSKKEIQLPDGSKVWLNFSSKLWYNSEFNDKAREIYLDGEAYFEVEKAPQKPFTIYAQNSVTKVTGTSFNVRAINNENHIIVTVLKGTVAFAKNTDMALIKVELIAGDKGLIDKTNQRISKLKNTDNNFLAWKTGTLVFKQTRLKDVVEKLSEIYGFKFEINNKTIQEYQLTATFEKQPLEKVVQIISLTLNLKTEQKDSTYILKQ